MRFKILRMNLTALFQAVKVNESCMLKYSYLLIALLFCNPVVATSGSEEAKSDTLTLKERLGIHTNALGWLLLTPNVGIEYDLMRNDHRKVSFLFSGRFNWASSQDFNSRYVYNIAGARAEVRWYYRMRDRRDWEYDLVKSTKGFFNRLLERKRFLSSSSNPNTYRAYYIGPYISYDNLSLKLGSVGRQGNILSAGVSFGYTLPLYIYDNGTGIDLELGASVGGAYVAYDKFGYNDDDKCYIDKGEHKGELLPYPVVTDLRVSLVYRMEPIRSQIKNVNEKSLAYDSTMYNLRLKYVDNYDNIYGLDELPKGYKGKYRVEKSFVGDSAAYARAYAKAVRKYKDSIADSHKDYIAKLNSEIKVKNANIKDLNSQIMAIAGVDSTKLLEELRPAYNYVEMPQKLLVHGSKLMLPNDSVGSVKEFKISFLDELINKYPAIENNGAITSVDSRLLDEYNSLRSILLNNKDSVSGISYFEFLTNAIPNINGFCIKPHNDAYVIGETQEESDGVITSRLIKFEHSKGAIPLPFLETNDTIYLKPKKTASFGIKSLNEEIEARNLVKIAEIQKKYGVVLKFKKEKTDKKSNKESKAALKKAKAEAKAAKKAAAAAAKAAKKAAADKAKAEKNATGATTETATGNTLNVQTENK